ncbi:MAG: zf-HC2 domain-containing protein [Actinomycetota bacterium]
MRLPSFFSRGMSCAEVADVMQSYLDGETDAATAKRVAAHLAKCRDCDIEVQVYDRICTSLRRRQVEVDPEILAALETFGHNLVRDDSTT